MRTPRKPQSALRCPLNEILGTEANVRLLRVLAHARTPIAAGELAARAALNRTSIYPALETLEQAGIVAFVGAGAQRQVQLRSTHPLARPIRALFRAEADRVEKMFLTLREIAQTLQPAPSAVWIEGPVLSDGDRAEDPLVCYVLADPAMLPVLVDQLSEKMIPVERAADVTIEVHGITRSELLARTEDGAARLPDAVLLAGIPPAAVRPDTMRARPNLLRSHEEHDVRARRLALAVATKLKRDPGLIHAARERVRNRERTASVREQRELKEWVRVLTTMSPSRLQRFLVDPGERATRLRQTLPLLDVLSPSERDAVLASSTDEEVRAIVSGRTGRGDAQ